MPRLPLLVALGVLAASLGCDGSPATPRPMVPDADVCAQLGVEQSLELGSDAGDFTLLDAGALVSQAWGPQGGDHVWASLRMSGVFGGGSWRENPECAEIDGGFCGPIAPEDAPTASIHLWHGDILVASTGEDMPFAAEGGIASGLTVFLRAPYSSAEMSWMPPGEIPQESIDAALAAEDAELLFEVEIRDACGTVLRAEQTVRIEIGWLESL